MKQLRTLISSNINPKQGDNTMKKVSMKQPTTDLLPAYVVLFKEFYNAKNSFMAQNMLNKITDSLIGNGYTLKQSMKFYKTELKGYIKE